MSNSVIQRLHNTVGKGASEYFDFSGIAAGDIVLSGEGAAGRKWTTISCGPLTVGTKTRIVSKFPFAAFPSRTFFEMSVSQRYRAYNGLVYLASQDTESTVPAPKALSIASIQQATTTLTVVLNEEYDGSVGNWVNIIGVPDNRLNYFNLCIASVSLDKKTLTATVADESTIPSVTVGPYAGVGTLTRIEPFGLANNAIGLRSSGTTATSNALLTRFGGGEGYYATGTITGSQLITTASTAAIWNVSANGQIAVSATSRFMFDCNSRDVTLLDKSADSNIVLTPRLTLTNVKPDDARDYFFVFETVSPASSPVPVAKIVSATKTGTTTATITTDVPHGLTAGLSYVQTYGIRDVTNFPNLAAATVVASIVSPTVFTIVIAGAVTATSYGGAVTLCNGGYTQPGLIGQTVQSVASDADGNVTVVGNTTWSGLQVGGLVNLHGVRDAATGADLGFDGVYRVVSIATTTLILAPVIDFTGRNVSPEGGVVTTKNAGGCIIDRVEYRTHDIGVETFEEKIVQIDGAGTSSAAKAVPVVMALTPTVAQGTAASIGSTGLGGWYVHPAIAAIADIASAAITTTQTSSAIANNLGNGFQVSFTVTSITGTTPSVDFRIEESYDGGTNWFTLYDFQRVTANGNYNSPVLRASGRHIRYIRTVGGTSPSITNAVTRTVLPFMPSEPQKRLIDRSLASTQTLNAVTPTLFQGAANNVQLVVNAGAITTTAPAFQLEGSEDGSNWYAIGSPLTSVASNTVEVTVSARSATYTRARVSTAGSGATIWYISLKAWS